MFIPFLFVVIGFQFVLVSTEKPSLDEVRSLIKKVREEANTVASSNVDLQSDISNVQKDSVRKIADFNIEKYNLSTGFKEEMDKLKVLQTNLSLLNQEEQRLSREANLVQASEDKLELGLTILEEDIKQLESRRKSGEEEKCFKIYPAMKESKLRLRRSNSSEEDEMIVLANELEHEKTRLDEVMNKNEELQIVLKDKKSLSNTALENLVSMISEINGDLSKAKARVSVLREKFDTKKDLVASLRERINQDLGLIKDKKESLKTLRNSVVGFGSAIQCYNRLEEELFRRDY